MDVEQLLREELQRDDWGVTPWDAPMPLLRQALRRRRQWRTGVVSLSLVVIVAGVGYAVAAIGDAEGQATVTPIATTDPTASANGDSQANATGFAGIDFGTPQEDAERQLSQLFGPPKHALQPQSLPPACGIDTATTWHDMTAYYFKQSFAGYVYDGSTPVNGHPVTTPSGLHVGESLSEAEAAGGAAFKWSYSQGGSWTLQTEDGKIVGNLTAVPPNGDIANIAAGALGCAGMAP